MICLAISGCASTAKYEVKLNTWIGVSEDALISGWGVPSKTYTLADGKKALEFVRKDMMQVGGNTYSVPVTTYQSGKVGDQEFTSTSTTYVPETTPMQMYKLSCRTSFILGTNGKVESWHHTGNNCVSN